MSEELTNEKIAERLGWHIETLEEPYIIDQWEPTLGKQIYLECPYVLVDNKGERRTSEWATPELCWEHIELPDFLGSVDAALTLIPHEVAFTLVKEANGPWWCRINDDAAEVSPSLSVAICECWLAWKRSLVVD